MKLLITNIEILVHSFSYSQEFPSGWELTRQGCLPILLMHVDYPNAKAFQGVFVVFKLYSNIFCFLQQIWIYIQRYIYTYIVCLFKCYPNKTLFRGFMSSLFKKLQLGFSLASFWASCNVPHSSLSLSALQADFDFVAGLWRTFPHLFLSLSPFRLQQQQLWNINAASWTQSASKSQKLSRCCNTLKAAGSYSLQPAASPLVASYLHSYVYVTLLLLCYAHSGLATDVVAFVQESPHNAPLKFT